MGSAPAGIPDLGVTTIGIKLLCVQSIVKRNLDLRATPEFCMGLRPTYMEETHPESMSFDGVGDYSTGGCVVSLSAFGTALPAGEQR
jgi:hypothetical protein